MMSEKQIRNSTTEFLIFTGQAGEQSIEARHEDETIWLTQQLMAELFQVQPQNITMHLKNMLCQIHSNARKVHLGLLPSLTGW